MNGLQTGLLAAAIGLAMFAGRADAVVAEHGFLSNAVNHCQAFTPGPSNTVRNRVIGSENVGTAPIAVACSFHSMFNGALASNEPPRRIVLMFANTNASDPIAVACTLLTGGPGFSIGYAVGKTTPSIPAGGVSSLEWDETDNPQGGATTLGSYWVGINCTLPQGGLIGETVVVWNQDNGIAS